MLGSVPHFPHTSCVMRNTAQGHIYLLHAARWLCRFVCFSVGCRRTSCIRQLVSYLGMNEIMMYPLWTDYCTLNFDVETA
jgi:hypothetical protein